MVLVDLKQELLIRAQVDPLEQGMQKAIPVSPEHMISLIISWPQRITPLVARILQRTTFAY